MHLFHFPFRIFFLSSAMLAAVMVPLWLLLWQWGGGLPLALPPLVWHQHEMLAGFLNAAIAGFLLTALCNWTGTPPIAYSRLVIVWLVWLSGRLGMTLGGSWPVWALGLDLAFMPLVAAIVAYRVGQARQRRQVIVVVMVMGFWALDVLFHLSAHPRFLHAAVLLAAGLILVIGGRITPAFTANWLRAQGQNPAQVRDTPLTGWAGLVAVVALVVLTATGSGWTSMAVALALTAALVTLLRLSGWAGWQIRGQPLLWILHVGHLWVVVGLILYALAAIGWVSTSAWLHALGAGAMGTMILGVMTRVAMGHTGRPLVLRPGAALAYGLILAAGSVRLAVALGALPYAAGLWLAGGLWSASFLMFLIAYTPVLVAPRVDGKPG